MTDKRMPTGVWRGKPVTYQVILVQVTNLLGGTRPWAQPFIGGKRQAVKVMVPNHRPFYLDNEDGTGLFKLLKREGSDTVYPNHTLGEPKELKVLDKGLWVTKVHTPKVKEIARAVEKYWTNEQ